MQARELIPLSPRQSARLATFKAATKGLHPWTVAKAMNALTPGVDWRRCSKGRMADAFATGEHRLDRHDDAALCKALKLVQSIFGGD